MNGAMAQNAFKNMIKEMIGDSRRRESEEKIPSGARSLHLTVGYGQVLTRKSARIRVMVRTAINMPKRDAKQQNKWA